MIRSQNLWVGVLTFASLGLYFPQSAFALSPPWEILQAQFRTSLEADPCVVVDPLRSVSAGHYELVVHETCNNASKAQALADLLSKTHDFGGTHVVVRVANS